MLSTSTVSSLAIENEQLLMSEHFSSFEETLFSLKPFTFKYTFLHRKKTTSRVLGRPREALVKKPECFRKTSAIYLLLLKDILKKAITRWAERKTTSPLRSLW